VNNLEVDRMIKELHNIGIQLRRSADAMERMWVAGQQIEASPFVSSPFVEPPGIYHNGVDD